MTYLPCIWPNHLVSIERQRLTVLRNRRPLLRRGRPESFPAMIVRASHPQEMHSFCVAFGMN